MKRKKNGVLVLVLLVAVVILGVGYAIGSNLTISGTATATPDQSNFSVVFDRATNGHEVTVENTTTVQNPSTAITAAYTDDTSASLTVNPFKAKGEVAVVSYWVKNTGEIDATVTVTPSVSDGTHGSGNATYFSISTDKNNFDLAAGASEKVTVTVTLAKAASTADVIADIDVALAATVKSA